MALEWQLTIAGALAGSVGLAEIVARYRSAPGFALKRLTAWSYILLNVAAGVGALFIVRAFAGPSARPRTSTSGARWWRASARSPSSAVRCL